MRKRQIHTTASNDIHLLPFAAVRKINCHLIQNQPEQFWSSSGKSGWGPAQWGQGVGALYKGGLGPGPVQEGGWPLYGWDPLWTDTHAQLKILPSPLRQWPVNVEFTLFWTIIFIPESGKLNCKVIDCTTGLGCFYQMWEQCLLSKAHYRFCIVLLCVLQNSQNSRRQEFHATAKKLPHCSRHIQNVYQQLLN